MRLSLRFWLSQLLILPLILCATLSASMAQGAASPDAGSEATPGPETLIELLENDAARAALIDRLRETANTATETVTEPDPVSFGRRIAEVTQASVENLATSLGNIWTAVTSAGDVLNGLDDLSLQVIVSNLGELALLIVVTFGIYLALRMLGKRVFRRFDAKSEDARPLRRIQFLVAGVLIDLGIVVLAWAAGYAIATLVFGEVGQISIRQTLYLNAFLVVGLVRAGIRAVLGPSVHHLRILPMEDETAKRVTRWASFTVAIVGYGHMLVVPIINAQVSRATGGAVTALIALVALAIAVYLVLRHRKQMADWMTGGSAKQSGASTKDWLARRWHWPILAYLFAMFVIVVSSPTQVVFELLLTSGQVVLVVIAGVAISAVLTQVMMRGIFLPDTVNARLPLLQTRLNRFVPKGLLLLRTVIVIFVLLFALDAINLVPLRDWLSSQLGLSFSAKLISVSLILLFAFAIWLGLTSFVDYRLNPEYGSVPTAREKTLLSLLRNAGTIALLIVTLMFTLAEIGLNIAPLLASAGVLGLAIGFGAQKFVQDIITGLFIQFENAINVGDVITAGGITGGVERLTIRSVSLRDLDGVFHIIPFSSVDAVSNYTRDFSYFVCDMGVAYRESVDEVKVAMLDAFEELRGMEDHAPNIIGDMEWFGVQSLADSAVVLRTRIKCVPGTQWGIGRVYNEICKRVFDERGIEIPFPHQTIFLGEAKDGSTQTFRVGPPQKRSIPDDAQTPAVEDDRAAEPSRDEPINPEEG